MKALHNIATTVVLLGLLAALPATLVSFRLVLDELSAAMPHPVSSVGQAELWLRMFGL